MAKKKIYDMTDKELEGAVAGGLMLAVVFFVLTICAGYIPVIGLPLGVFFFVIGVVFGTSAVYSAIVKSKRKAEDA